MIQYDLAPKSEVYIATGTATEFNCGFYVGDMKDVYVEIDGSSVAAAGNYDVVKDSGGMGRVVFSSAVTSGAKVQMFRLTPMTQGVDLKQGEAFYPEQVESAFDKLTMIVQEIRGGTVHAGGSVDSAAYAERAGAADTADYLNEPDRSAIIGSAAAAVGGGLQTTIVDYMARQGTVPYASSAGGLTPTAKADIIASAGGGVATLTKVDFSSGSSITVRLNGSGAKYTTGDGDETYTQVGSGLGGVLMGNIYAPEGADDTWTANLSIGDFGTSGGSGVILLHPTAYWVSSGSSTYGVTYQPLNAYVYIPIDPETRFYVYVIDRGVGLGTSNLKFFPRVPIEGPGPGPTPPTPTVPEAPVPYAVPTSATNGNVTVYADYSSDSIQKQAQIESSGWTVYQAGGVVVSSNCTVYFRGGNDTGYSEVASYAVSNIDKTAPALELLYDNVTPNLPYDTITATTESGATIQYRAPGASAQWVNYTGPVNVYDNGTWTFKATDAAGNITTKTISYSNLLSGHETPGDDSGDPED